MVEKRVSKDCRMFLAFFSPKSLSFIEIEYGQLYAVEDLLIYPNHGLGTRFR